MTAYINGISYYLPNNILDNIQLSSMHPEWSVEKISEKTGIYERHISSKLEFSSDMALSAIELFFKEHSIKREEIDYLLFCTQTPDYLLPTTACVLQDKAGLPKSCGALDFNLGCSGYIYGLGLAKGLVETGQAKNVLLVTAETYSKLINDLDKSNKTIFGDAASVSLITSEPKETLFKATLNKFVYGTDGSGAEYLIVRNSGMKSSKEASTEEVNEAGDYLKNDDYLYMNGKEIFQFTAFEVPKLIKKVLNENALELKDINMFVFHQANEFMLDFIRKRCAIHEDNFFISIKDIGNTVSSTIPIALIRAIKENKIGSNDKVILAGFGVGLSMGAVMIKFN